MFIRLDLPQIFSTWKQILSTYKTNPQYWETNRQYLEKVVLIWDIVYKYGNWRLETSHCAEILLTMTHTWLNLSAWKLEHWSKG
jgi:hypothetical protein